MPLGDPVEREQERQGAVERPVSGYGNVDRDGPETLDGHEHVADDDLVGFQDLADMVLVGNVPADRIARLGDGVNDPAPGIDAGDPLHLVGVNGTGNRS